MLLPTFQQQQMGHTAQWLTVFVVSVPQIVNHNALGSSLWEKNIVELQNSWFIKWPKIDSVFLFFSAFSLSRFAF